MLRTTYLVMCPNCEARLFVSPGPPTSPLRAAVSTDGMEPTSPGHSSIRSSSRATDDSALWDGGSCVGWHDFEPGMERLSRAQDQIRVFRGIAWVTGTALILVALAVIAAYLVTAIKLVSN